MASRAAPPPPSRTRPGGGGFALLTPAFLDELRARTSLSGLIGRSVKLAKAGNEYKACCPFHHEKTPSFYVNDDKAFYHCFGCGAHGDAIRFLTEARGLPFVDAVKELADAAGMEMPQPDAQSREKAERAAGLHDVMAAAGEWFRAQLGTSAAAREYLNGRGFAPATLAAFGFGYAPAGRRGLADALTRFPEAMLVEAGLLIRPEGGGPCYDRFRERVMIPINDSRGRIIAFGGRILGAGEPKYLNSPETPLFDKGATLWNLHRAAPAARRTGRLVIVEGYLDGVALHQAGLAEVVAPLGTALTERQMERAWSLVDVPLLCFDGDAAGTKAALRAAERAMPLLAPGKSLAFAVLPAGKDPDDIVRTGGIAAFEAAIAVPTSLLRLLYDREKGDGDMAQPEMRAGFRARLEALAGRCADRVVAQEYRRSFNDLFYEEYGWKKTERRTFAAAMLNTLPEHPGDLRDRYLRSLLYGLGRFPAALRDHVEQIAALAIADRRLAGCRDMLVRAALRGGDLDGDCVAQIFAADGFAEIQEFRLQRDLRFAFTRSDAPEEQRVAQLGGLLRFLCDERELDEGLSGLDRAALIAATNDEYLAIEAERQYLRTQRASLFDWAYELGADGQDHGTTDGEDEHGRDDGEG